MCSQRSVISEPLLALLLSKRFIIADCNLPVPLALALEPQAETKKAKIYLIIHSHFTIFFLLSEQHSIAQFTIFILEFQSLS